MWTSCSGVSDGEKKLCGASGKTQLENYNRYFQCSGVRPCCELQSLHHHLKISSCYTTQPHNKDQPLWASVGFMTVATHHELGSQHKLASWSIAGWKQIIWDQAQAGMEDSGMYMCRLTNPCITLYCICSTSLAYNWGSWAFRGNLPNECVFRKYTKRSSTLCMFIGKSTYKFMGSDK